MLFAGIDSSTQATKVLWVDADEGRGGAGARAARVGVVAREGIRATRDATLALHEG